VAFPFRNTAQGMFQGANVEDYGFSGNLLSFVVEYSVGFRQAEIIFAVVLKYINKHFCPPKYGDMTTIIFYHTAAKKARAFLAFAKLFSFFFRPLKI
jgi:hypothetical protein